MNKFDIGDRVKCIGNNKTAVVEDKLFSSKTESWMYVVKFDDSSIPFTKPLTEKELTAVIDTTYRFDVFRADNMMVAVMYEVYGNVEREIDRFHGHIIHEGAIGVAQAASYAMKKIYTNMNGGAMLVYGGEEDDV